MHNAISRVVQQDERTDLQKMRRKELYYYAVAKKVPADIDEPAEDVRKRLRDHGFNGTDAVETIRQLMAEHERQRNGQSASLSIPQEMRDAESETFPRRSDGSMRSVTDTIDTMTMPQLRKAIKAAGMKQSPKDTADILRARLRGKDIA